MGKELSCTMHFEGATHAGRLYLETEYLLFRGAVRVKMTFSELTSVSAAAGVLRVCTLAGEAAFEIGADAAKCADKILHPPSRLAKLGIRQDLTVQLTGEIEQNFVSDLEQAGAKVVRSNADVTFWGWKARHSWKG